VKVLQGATRIQQLSLRAWYSGSKLPCSLIGSLASLRCLRVLICSLPAYHADVVSGLQLVSKLTLLRNLEILEINAFSFSDVNETKASLQVVEGKFERLESFTLRIKADAEQPAQPLQDFTSALFAFFPESLKKLCLECILKILKRGREVAGNIAINVGELNRLLNLKEMVLKVDVLHFVGEVLEFRLRNLKTFRLNIKSIPPQFGSFLKGLPQVEWLEIDGAAMCRLEAFTSVAAVVKTMEHLKCLDIGQNIRNKFVKLDFPVTALHLLNIAHLKLQLHRFTLWGGWIVLERELCKPQKMWIPF
jgi:hypothetical protein